jgi:hypothetical protein
MEETVMNKSRLISAISAVPLAFLTTFSTAAVLPLEGRLETSPGSGVFLAYYDPNLDVTWAADAYIRASDSWDNQTAWATSLSIGGISGWRLPNANVNNDGTVVNCQGGGVSGCIDNEMGYLYWEEGISFSAPGPFSNIQEAQDYWSSTIAPVSVDRYALSFDTGAQSDYGVVAFLAAWPVRSGDVPATVVPLPSAVLLFGGGLLGLLGITRRKTKSV